MATIKALTIDIRIPPRHDLEKPRLTPEQIADRWARRRERLVAIRLHVWHRGRAVLRRRHRSSRPQQRRIAMDTTESGTESRVNDTMRAIGSLKEDDAEAGNTTSRSDIAHAVAGAAVAEAMEDGRTKTFNTFSNALARRLIAEQESLREECADIDAEIERLNEKRTDIMLAQSMISAAVQAAERNR